MRVSQSGFFFKRRWKSKAAVEMDACFDEQSKDDKEL